MMTSVKYDDIRCDDWAWSLWWCDVTIEADHHGDVRWCDVTIEADHHGDVMIVNNEMPHWLLDESQVGFHDHLAANLSNRSFFA